MVDETDAEMADIMAEGEEGSATGDNERTVIRHNLIAMPNDVARCNENAKKNDRWKSL